MSEHPSVTEAKAKLKELVVPAVETLGALVESEHAGIRLGAAREILDRGGVPAKTEHNVQIDVTLDAEIEQLIRSVRRQVEGRDAAAALIEDAIVVEDSEPSSLAPGEQAIAYQQQPPDPEPEPEDDGAWWQAAPNA